MPKTDNEVLVIGITGMPGAKKTETAEILSGYGIPFITLSSFLTEELRKRQMALSPSNYANLASELRKEYGDDFLVKKAWGSVNSKAIIIDGIRSPSEIAFLRSVTEKFILILVYASPETRFSNLKKDNDPYLSAPEQFATQEKYENAIGVGEVSTQADYVIINENYAIKSLKEQVKRFLQFLHEKYQNSKITQTI
jgi:dephospho-CoA kinase